MQYANVIWRNGQPYSEIFDDIYYSSNASESIPGEGEFKHVFFSNNNLPARWEDCTRFIIGELGFGSGLNCILTIREWLNQPENALQHKRRRIYGFDEEKADKLREDGRGKHSRIEKRKAA